MLFVSGRFANSRNCWLMHQFSVWPVELAIYLWIINCFLSCMYIYFRAYHIDCILSYCIGGSISLYSSVRSYNYHRFIIGLSYLGLVLCTVVRQTPIPCIPSYTFIWIYIRLYSFICLSQRMFLIQVLLRTDDNLLWSIPPLPKHVSSVVLIQDRWKSSLDHPSSSK